LIIWRFKHHGVEQAAYLHHCPLFLLLVLGYGGGGSLTPRGEHLCKGMEMLATMWAFLSAPFCFL
jgi:hypothetical protein